MSSKESTEGLVKGAEKGARNVNAAKLFIRWILGEADGKGEGYKPYFKSGAWSMRTDVADESIIPMESLKLWNLDSDYVYEHKEEMLAAVLLGSCSLHRDYRSCNDRNHF